MRTSTQVVLYPVGGLKYLIKSPFTKSLFSTHKKNSLDLFKQTKKCHQNICKRLLLKEKHKKISARSLFGPDGFDNLSYLNI